MEHEHLGRLTAALSDRYTIERELGRGGAAVVFLAADRKHGRSVALKVLMPRVGTAIGAERFQREITIAARLTHPHIMPLHDSGEAAGLLYYVMPFMRGESLRDRLAREGKLPVADAVRIACEVASALDRAHSDGIIHRDIKPENILIEGGYSVVADFGIAQLKTAAENATITQSGVALGTPMYMSPEQAIGSADLNGRSDLYSLGCVLYEMLIGAPPFVGGTMRETLIRHSIEPLPSVCAQRAEVPEHVDRALHRVMEKDPADRFATGSEFAAALRDPAITFPLAIPMDSGAGSTTASAAAGESTSQGLWDRLRTAFSGKPASSAPLVANAITAPSIPVMPVASSATQPPPPVTPPTTPPVVTNNLSVEVARARKMNEAISGGRKALTAPIVTTPSGRVPIESLAVLPFSTMNDDVDAEYLSEGITETIMNKLAGVAGLRVVPRSVVFRYKNSTKDPIEIAREVHARAVVTGRILQRGSTLVIKTELVDSVTEAQLWGEQYNRKIDDIFAVQEEMAGEITRSLRLKLSGEEQAGLNKRFTENTQAYQAYLRGRHYWSKRTVEGLRRALEHFQQAIDLDPAYALAYDGLSDTYNILGYYNTHRPRDSYPRGKEAASRALALDPELAEAHASMGYVRLFFDYDWQGAGESFARAIELNPKYATAHQWKAWHLFVVERFDEALDSLRHAQALDPLSLIINDHLGYALLLAGKPQDALIQLRATRDLDPTFPWTYWRLGSVYLALERHDESIEAFDTVARMTDGGVGLGYKGLVLGIAGCHDEAQAVLARLDELAATRYVSPLDYALTHAGLGRLDETFAALRQCFEDRVSDFARVKTLPWPDDVRRDPRYATMLHNLGLTA